jgi:ADP-ribose pyrophosphatase YjhB (NUDIX family)
LEEGVARECKEELNITVNPNNIYIINLWDCVGDKRYLQIWWLVKKRTGEMQIMEPKKCDEIRFFPLDSLPEDLFFGTKVNIDLFLKNAFYDKSCNYYKRD